MDCSRGIHPHRARRPPGHESIFSAPKYLGISNDFRLGVGWAIMPILHIWVSPNLGFHRQIPVTGVTSVISDRQV